MPNGQPKIYPGGGTPIIILFGVVVLSVVAVAATGYFVLSAWWRRDPTYIYAVGAFWAVVPPVWFWLEYELIFRRWGNADAFEFFKYGQQVVVAIWAGMTLLLFALSQSNHFNVR